MQMHREIIYAAFLVVCTAMTVDALYCYHGIERGNMQQASDCETRAGSCYIESFERYGKLLHVAFHKFCVLLSLTYRPTHTRTIFGRPFVKRFDLCYRTVVYLYGLVCLSVCLSVTLVYCGQTVALIKMKLGTDVGVG